MRPRKGIWKRHALRAARRTTGTIAVVVIAAAAVAAAARTAACIAAALQTVVPPRIGDQTDLHDEADRRAAPRPTHADAQQLSLYGKIAVTKHAARHIKRQASFKCDVLRRAVSKAHDRKKAHSKMHLRAAVTAIRIAHIASAHLHPEAANVQNVSAIYIDVLQPKAFTDDLPIFPHHHTHPFLMQRHAPRRGGAKSPPCSLYEMRACCVRTAKLW